MLENIKMCWKGAIRTLKHYFAFLRTERQYLGYYKYKFHDLDKLLMYIFLPFLGVKMIHRIHRTINKHHIRNEKTPLQCNYEEAAIDWECCRFTKPDEPMSAREYLNSLKDELCSTHWDNMDKALNKLGL